MGIFFWKTRKMFEKISVGKFTKNQEHFWEIRKLFEQSRFIEKVDYWKSKKLPFFKNHEISERSRIGKFLENQIFSKDFFFERPKTKFGKENSKIKIQYSRHFFQFDKKFYQGLKNLDYAIVVNHF